MMKDKSTPEKRYTPIAIEHMNNPRRWGQLPQTDGYARITGACGDTMEISLNVKNNIITECRFDTDGCGATVACGSIVTEMATGKPLAIARQIDQDAILAFCGGLPDGNAHCALLAAETLRMAIDDYMQVRMAPWKRIYRITK